MNGLIVKYADPLEGEETFRFVVLEDNGSRLLIQVLDWHNPLLVPTEVVSRNDVVVA